jgi:hypothetical protein
MRLFLTREARRAPKKIGAGVLTRLVISGFAIPDI